MTDTTYNGWANYPTWAVGMYLDGNYTGEGTYLYVTELVTDWLADGRDRWSIADGLEEFVRSDVAYDEESEGYTPNPLASDLLGYALDTVDWYELADAWIATSREETPA